MFVTCPVVSNAVAVVAVKTHVQNDDAASRTFSVRTTILDGTKKKVTATSPPVTLAAGASQEITQQLTVVHPRLWSPGRLFCIH